MVKINLGEIWWADLGESMGSEPSLKRPVLIVQENHFNQSRLATVIVLSITSNTRLSEMPGNVLLKREESGLAKYSVINVSQIATIDKSWLENKAGFLSKMLMEEEQARDFGRLWAPFSGLWPFPLCF